MVLARTCCVFHVDLRDLFLSVSGETRPISQADLVTKQTIALDSSDRWTPLNTEPGVCSKACTAAIALKGTVVLSPEPSVLKAFRDFQ